MKSIALKLWMGMIALVVFMLLLLWFFQIVFLENFYQQFRIDEVTKKAAAIGEEWDSVDFSKSQDKLEKLSIDYNAMVDLFDSKGNVVTLVDRGPMHMFSSIASNMSGDILKGQARTERAVHPRLNSEFAILGIPVKANETVIGGLVIYLPLTPVKETSSLLKVQLIYISIIVLLASVIISYFLSNLFTRPILEINNAAERMASGDLEVKLDIESKDEIGRLAGTVNYLAIELSKIEQLRKDLIANISHELRTPLSLIRGYAETIRDISGEVKEKREKQLGIVIEESERLEKIVEDILNLSQIESGYFILNIDKFRLDRTLQSVMKRYDLLGEELKLHIDFVTPESMMVLGDESRIEQVLYNLMNNAVNHTPEGGSVIVKAIDKEDTIRVEISDTGSGISKEDLKHIWERYYKVEKSGIKRHIGTGLGLAIVKSILESHNSRFGVESKEGGGTTFWFEMGKSEIEKK